MEDLDDREGSLELVELTPIEFFNSAFRRQTLAHQASGKRVYPCGSGRTIRRQKKAKRDLEASLETQGFLPLHDFLERKARSATLDVHRAEAEGSRTAHIGTLTLAPIFEEEEEEEEETAEANEALKRALQVKDSSKAKEEEGEESDVTSL
jgi:hypothetical protein